MIDETWASSLRRHDLLHVAPGAWKEALRSRPDTVAGIDVLEGWADAGWPVIVRRRDPADSEDLVPIAVPLPPSAGRTRVALEVPRAAVCGRHAPLSLERARAVAPRAWQASIDALLAAGVRHRSRASVFGSLLWQALTGLAYVRASSDLDAAWAVGKGTDVVALVETLGVVDHECTPRIDGELIFPDGGGVSWRELARRPEAVVVKRLDRVESCRLDTVLDGKVGAS